MRRRAALALVVACLAPAATASAEPGTWEGLGPPSGVLGLLAIDPLDPSTIYGGSFSAVYRSDDRGATWSRPAAEQPAFQGVTSVVPDPVVPGRVYAVSAGELYSSDDRGTTWRVLPLRGVASVVALGGEEPALVASTFERGLQRSTDAGATWSDSSTGLADPNAVYGLLAAPSDDATVYVLAGDGVYRSQDGGASWSLRGMPPGAFFLTAAAVDPGDPSVLFVGDQLTVWRSRDGGAGWQATGALGAGDDFFVAALAVARTPALTLYALTDRTLYRSRTSGDSWQPLAENVFGSSGPGAVVIDSADPGRLYLLDVGQVFVSQDAGDTFAPSSDGLPGRPIQALAALGTTVLAGSSFGGVSRSDDGGRTWLDAHSLEGEPIEAIAIGEGISLAATYRGAVYRSTVGSAWEPAQPGIPAVPVWDLALDPSRPGRALAATELGVYRLGPDAERWRRSSEGLSDTGVRSLAFAPSRPNVLYAGLDRGGVFRSATGGVSWRPAGLGRRTVLAVGVHPQLPRVAFAVTRRAGMWKTADAGRTWERFAPSALTGSVAADPETGTILVASGRAVLRSTDGGETFTAFTSGLPPRGGSPVDSEADVPRTVLELAAVPGGAYAATWGGVYEVRFP
jgi:photosystem II stability/assembly factor-like uncharacterized protein